MVDKFYNYGLSLLAGTEPPDLTSPAKYIGGVLLAIFAAFSILGVIILVVVFVIIAVRLKVASAMGDVKGQKKAGKDFIISIIAFLLLAIAAPLCTVFSIALLKVDPEIGTDTFMMVISQGNNLLREINYETLFNI